jgi:hypothetical protein
MNPYLEQEDVWHNFHEQFMPHVMEVLVPQVRPGYIIKIDEHVYIHELPADERWFLGRADISLTQARTPPSGSTTGALLEAPAYGHIPPAVDIVRQSFLEIRDRRNREVVTIIELLSPSNKETGPDREQYLAKRRSLLASSVHFVEIDLLRGGPRLPLQDLPDCDYYALVSRCEERPRVALWPIRVRDHLPVIPIPLRAPDPPARLDLQAILHHLYDAGGYEDYIYTGTPRPPLHPEDAAWAQQLVPPRLGQPG